MATVTREAKSVNPALESDPETWGPEWDNWHWSPDVLPSDAGWAVREFNADEDLDETAAAESAYLDAHELGMIPAGCAFEPNTADGILHQGSDPAWCPCYQCVEARTRRFAER